MEVYVVLFALRMFPSHPTGFAGSLALSGLLIGTAIEMLLYPPGWSFGPVTERPLLRSRIKYKSYGTPIERGVLYFLAIISAYAGRMIIWFLIPSIILFAYILIRIIRLTFIHPITEPADDI